jgi:hypothetical protein
MHDVLVGTSDLYEFSCRWIFEVPERRTIASLLMARVGVGSPDQSRQLVVPRRLVLLLLG